MPNQVPQSSITVLGSGCWGTALANCLAKNNHRVTVWGLEIEALDEINRDHTNNRYLPGHRLERSIRGEKELDAALIGARFVFSAVPARHFYELLRREGLVRAVSGGVVLVNASKGLSEFKPESGEKWAFVSEAYSEVFGDVDGYVNISGPTFALEVAEEKLTSILVSANDSAVVDRVRALLESDYLKTDAGDDVIGSEVCGAIKNVYAVLVGAYSALSYSANTHSAVLTACLGEMKDFGLGVGAKIETFLSVAGVGDLILTTGSDKSRNYRLGKLVAEGASLEQAQQRIGQEVEGYHTVQAADWLNRRHGRRLKILTAVGDFLAQKRSAQDTIDSIFNDTFESGS